MKRILILLIAIFLIGCVWAQNDSIKTIDGIDFEIPAEYHGGNLTGTKYEFEDEFSIECIDKNIPKHIGLWASENDYSRDLSIGNHPVRHYCQYNQYIKANQSHAYFASENSIYEIVWTGNNITKDMEKMIKNTPSSKISDDEFKNMLDNSIKIYKQEKIDRLNSDAEYNYLEAKYSSADTDKNDNAKFNEILLTYSK